LPGADGTIALVANGALNFTNESTATITYWSSAPFTVAEMMAVLGNETGRRTDILRVPASGLTHADIGLTSGSRDIYIFAVPLRHNGAVNESFGMQPTAERITVTFTPNAYAAVNRGTGHASLSAQERLAYTELYNAVFGFRETATLTGIDTDLRTAEESASRIWKAVMYDNAQLTYMPVNFTKATESGTDDITVEWSLASGAQAAYATGYAAIADKFAAAADHAGLTGDDLIDAIWEAVKTESDDSSVARLFVYACRENGITNVGIAEIAGIVYAVTTYNGNGAYFNKAGKDATPAIAPTDSNVTYGEELLVSLGLL